MTNTWKHGLAALAVVAFAVVVPLPAVGAVQQGGSLPTAPGKPSAGTTLTKSTSVTWTWSAATDSGGFQGISGVNAPSSLRIALVNSATAHAADFRTATITDYLIDIGTTPGGTDIASGVSTNNSTNYTRTGLADGTYYARVRAVNSYGSGPYSPNSDGVTVDTTPPTFSSVTATSITSSSATITWTTNEPATSQIHSGTTSGSYPTTSSLDSSLVTSHSVPLSGLAAGTTYYYQAMSTDQVGNAGTSSQASFTTTAAATTSSPTATATTSTTPQTTKSATTATTSASPTATATTSASPTNTATQTTTNETPSIATTVAGATGSLSLTSWFWWPLLILLLLAFIFIWWYLHRRHEPRETTKPESGQQ